MTRLMKYPRAKSKPVALVPLEDEEQLAVLDYCDIWHMPYFHVNNEMWTDSWKQKARSKKLGTKKGVPDLFIFIPIGQNPVTREWHYQLIVVEMKRRKGSKTSDEQIEWGLIFQRSGVPHAVCKGATEAIAFIKYAKEHYAKHWRKQQELADSLVEALNETWKEPKK